MSLLFVANWDGDEEIYQIQANGDNLTKLTNNSVDDIMPGWSPDGGKIAFLSRDASKNIFSLMLAKPDGSQPTQINPNNISIGVWSNPASGEHSMTYPNQTFLPIQWFVWSPDSQRIAYRGSDEKGSYIMVSDVSNPQPIAIEDDLWVNPSYTISWSQDGQLIAFDAPVDVSTLWLRVQIARTDGSNLQTIYSDVVSESNPEWHPFKQKLLVISHPLDDSHEQLYLMKPDGTERKALTNTTTTKVWAFWSPNGQEIAYGANIVNEYSEPIRSGIYIIDDQGNLLRTIVEEKGIDNIHFSWAPDSRHLAFLKEEKNKTNLYIADICNGNVSLLKENISEYTPSWKP